MLETIKFDVAALRGHEVKHLVNVNGCFALSDDLKPQLLPLQTITVALPKDFGEYHMAAVGLLSVVTNRKINFEFVEKATDPGYCEADFCLTDFSPIWGGDNDTWETMIGVLRNTPWLLAEFKEPQAAEGFFREVWDEHYDGLEDRMALDRFEGRSLYKTAVHQLMYAQQRMSTLFKLCKIRDKMMDVLRWEVLRDRPGVLIVPDDAKRMPLLTMLQWIATVQKEADTFKSNPVLAVVRQEGDSWIVWPGMLLDDSGHYEEVPDMNKALAHENIMKKFGCRAEDKPLCRHAVCPTKELAFATAVWMTEKRAGKNTRLEDLVP